MLGTTDRGFEHERIASVRSFVEAEVLPVVAGYDARDEFPEQLVGRLRELELFGITIPVEYGGLGLGLGTYSRLIAELSRGWISLAGVLNTHFIVSWMLVHHGSPDQRARHLPRLATGELRAAFSMTEPHCGSDLAAIRTQAVRVADGWEISGEKRWQANGLRAGLMAMLVKTDPQSQPATDGMSCMLLEKTPGVEAEGGFTLRSLQKLGYLGIDSTAMRLERHVVPEDAILGGEPGMGFRQMMGGVEVGRINVAARAVGVAERAFELAFSYAHKRSAFGKPIAAHQSIAFRLAEMATRLEAARLMVQSAAEVKDRGQRADLEAGMAKLFASEACHEIVLDAMRIHGGNGFSKEFEIERLYRDAPLLLLGEGTSEIQKLIISRGLERRLAPADGATP